MKDIIFKQDNYIFSYRVGAVLIYDGKILLQKVPHDDGFAFPGGHVSLGETSASALCREMKEELHVDIRIERLLMVGENFCPWGNLPCQQINMFYLVSLCDSTQVLKKGTFNEYDEMGNIREDLEMCWVSMDDLPEIKLYPFETKDILLRMPDEISYFVHHP